MDFNLTGVTLPPVDVDEILGEFPDLCSGLLMFDIWIANLDRHARNMSADLLAKPPVLNLFDHSHALFGYEAARGAERLNAYKDRLGISWKTGDILASGSHRHCLLDATRNDTYFGKWIERISEIPDYMIEDTCQAADGLGVSSVEVSTALDFLKYRRDNLSQLIDSNKSEFKGIQSWSLIK